MLSETPLKKKHDCVQRETRTCTWAEVLSLLEMGETGLNAKNKDTIWMDIAC